MWSFRGARELRSWTGPSRLRCPFRISCTWRGEVGPNFGQRRRQLRISLRCRNSQLTPTPTPLGPPPSGLGSSHSPRCQGPPSHLPDAHPVSRARPREKEAEIVPTPAGRRLLPAARFTPSSALTQHALPGPELSWSRSPWGQGGQKKQEVWDGLSPGAGSPKRQALRSALPPTPTAPRPPSPSGTSLGSVLGAGLNSKNPDVLGGSFKAQSQASLRGRISRFKDRGCTGGGENALVLMKW